jgi:hypothetical protein
VGGGNENENGRMMLVETIGAVIQVVAKQGKVRIPAEQSDEGGEVAYTPASDQVAQGLVTHTKTESVKVTVPLEGYVVLKLAMPSL